MSYQMLPTIIFLLAVFGLIILFLRRLPEAADLEASKPAELPIETKLSHKGLPAQTISRFWAWLKFWSKKLWNFALEAKDLKPAETTGYRIRKLFQNNQKTEPAAALPPANLPVATAQLEQDLLTAIKDDPKNLANYDELGKYYYDNNNFPDATDIYRYLTQHDSGNAEYHARLANCYYRVSDFQRSAEEFEKSVSLDSTQPNRYYNLGLAWQSAKNLEKSQLALRRAIALEPNNSKYHFALGDVLEKLKKKKEAIAEFRQARQLDPGNLQAFERLKRLL